MLTSLWCLWYFNFWPWTSKVYELFCKEPPMQWCWEVGKRSHCQFGGICKQDVLLELVSKELNHLAAILHVYAGGLNFMK